MPYAPASTPGKGELAEYLSRELRRLAIAVNALDGQDTVTYTNSPMTLGPENDFVGVSATSSMNVTLPPLAGNFGRKFQVKKLDATAAVVVLDGNGSETIDGAATKTLSAQYAFFAVIGGVTDWHIIGR
jgi:hypothetical protein